MIEDLETVLDYVRGELGIHNISLCGICSGARIALHYAMKGHKEITNVIALSSSPLHAGVQAREVAARRTISVIRDYGGKALHVSTWRRLFSGELHLNVISTNIAKGFSGLFSKHKPRRQRVIQKNAQQNFLHFSGKVLLIHGERDPETPVSLKQIEQLLNQYRILYTSRIIEGANHSFYSLQWKQEIIDSVCEWLTPTRSNLCAAENTNLK